MVLMPPESPSPKCPDASQVPVFPPLLPSGGQNPGDSGVLGGAVRHSGSATAQQSSGSPGGGKVPQEESWWPGGEVRDLSKGWTPALCINSQKNQATPAGGRAEAPGRSPASLSMSLSLLPL
jgi:hypothetical protein